jgi:hypothetical protein
LLKQIIQPKKEGEERLFYLNGGDTKIWTLASCTLSTHLDRIKLPLIDCYRCHPGPGPPHSVSLGTSIALQGIEVEYFGHAWVPYYSWTEIVLDELLKALMLERLPGKYNFSRFIW